MIVQYTKYETDIFRLTKMNSDVVYGNLLCNFVISSAINYKKISSVKLGSVKGVFSTNRFIITSGNYIFTLFLLRKLQQK